MDIQALKATCRQVRRDVITMCAAAGSGHPGGSLSCTEALVALYFDVMKVDPKNPKDPARDRFVLSKGHAAPALYGTLMAKGFVDHDEIKGFRQLHSMPAGAPATAKKVPRRGRVHRLAGSGHLHRYRHGAGRKAYRATPAMCTPSWAMASARRASYGKPPWLRRIIIWTT